MGTRKSQLPEVPSTLADVALIDGPTIAASLGVSLSKWHALVKDKVAPQPALRAPRCTRWRLSEVRDFLCKHMSDAETGAAVVTRATAASAAAKRKRAADRAAETA